MYITQTNSGDGAFMGKNPILQRAEDILHRLSILEQRLEALSDRLSPYCLPSEEETLDKCRKKEEKETHKFNIDLNDKIKQETDNMVLICPIHKLLCTGCEYSTRVPITWLSEELQEELKSLRIEVNKRDRMKDLPSEGKERKGRDILSPLEELLVTISGRVSEIIKLVERMTDQVR